MSCINIELLLKLIEIFEPLFNISFICTIIGWLIYLIITLLNINIQQKTISKIIIFNIVSSITFIILGFIHILFIMILL